LVAKIYTIALVGLEGHLIEVEVDVTRGLHKFYVVGLGDKAIQESRNRVAASIKNSGMFFPKQRITVNLAPADLLKSGPSYDFPIAVGLLSTTGQIRPETKDSIYWGELSLGGKLKNTRGALAVADVAKRLGFKTIFVPTYNAREAGYVAGINIKPVKSLEEVVKHCEGKKIKNFKKSKNKSIIRSNPVFDFCNVKGQEQPKRALEIAAAGGHNVLLTGTPGSGKTFLSRCLVSIMPKMEFEESVEVTKIHSVAGMLTSTNLIVERPFRNPHHTSSEVSLIGGGSIPKPGEISLAHRGVLFLDEFNEFTTKALESLRQPIEDNIVNISRASGVMSFPANFMLVAAMNPCKCGYLGDEEKECTCSQFDIERYARKISGPIIDRIDLQLYVKRVSRKALMGKGIAEGSSTILKRVETARQVQFARFKKSKTKNRFTNAELDQFQIKQFIKLDSKALEILKRAIDSLKLTARAYFRTLKVARTIADLEGKEAVNTNHITEALSYRIQS